MLIWISINKLPSWRTTLHRSSKEKQTKTKTKQNITALIRMRTSNGAATLIFSSADNSGENYLPQIELSTLQWASY